MRIWKVLGAYLEFYRISSGWNYNLWKSEGLLCKIGGPRANLELFS
jgi:hypothetical protein